MTGVSLQFHATNAEIVAMATGWAREFSLHACLGMLFADRAVAVENGDFGTALRIVPSPDFVVLGMHPLHLPEGADLHQLKGLNDDIFVLQPGAERETGLAESMMVGFGENPHATTLWRRLIARARRSMRSGAVLTNPSGNQLARYPSHRFTDGALRLQESGVAMRTIAGGGLYRLTPDPTPNPLHDQDMVALATISHAMYEWIQAERLPSELFDELKERLARYNVVTRRDTAGDVAITIFEVTRRLHHAFARYGGPFTPSPRATTYFLHFPTEEQATAAAAALAGRSTGADVERDFPQTHDTQAQRHMPWRLRVTLPGTAPDLVHRHTEADLINLAHEHHGSYAGWQRSDDDR